jgi:signal transduction histidine kinase
MDQARDIVGSLLNQAEARIGNSAERQRRSIEELRWITLLGALVIFVVIAGAVWVVLRYTRQLIEAQDEVRVLNAGLEGRVRDRTAELARANEEIQRFAYIVTHDLRAPLVNIMGFTSELETSLVPIQTYVEKPDAPEAETVVAQARQAALEDVPEALGFIRSSTRKMDGLINAILKLSREGRRMLRPERIDLHALLETAAASIRHQVVEAGGELAIDEALPYLVSDRLALEQIFGNLLDNAVKYRAQGRPLRIHVRAREEPGQHVRIEVEDNGRGIAPQDHGRVFDLFRRSGMQDQPGEGIGLAHVRTMIRNLGGEITLRSALAQGTTLTLVLPRDLRTIIGVQ